MKRVKQERVSLTKLAHEMGMPSKTLGDLIENGTFPFGEIVYQGYKRKCFIYQDSVSAFLQLVDVNRGLFNGSTKTC